MDSRKAVKAAAIALAVAAVAGKALWRPADHGGGAAPGADLVQKPGERGFTLGTLAFAPCELETDQTAATTPAWCAPFQVPEDWQHPDGRRIDLKLALVRGNAPLAERDLVVLLAGGPGQAATEAWPRARGGFAPLLEHRNVLLLDQRGTGGSNALTCKRAGDEDEQALDLERVRTQTRACLETVSAHADPRLYTTTSALRDLEAVRAALGGPRFDLVGVRAAQEDPHLLLHLRGHRHARLRVGRRTRADLAIARGELREGGVHPRLDHLAHVARLAGVDPDRRQLHGQAVP